MRKIILITLYTCLASITLANNAEFLQNNKLKKGDHFQYYYTELIEKRQEPVNDEYLNSGSDEIHRILFDFKIKQLKKDKLIFKVEFLRNYEYSRNKKYGKNWDEGYVKGTELVLEEIDFLSKKTRSLHNHDIVSGPVKPV
ncbi:MAG: hypothetical protein MI922_09820, partial [Bacteroidales bacterium]|nr:hypothetical protein [Bacteroidales bacterium]